QYPDDIPNDILGQLGNRIQHALRAYTPRDQKALKAAAESFTVNPKINVPRTIAELAVGEALVSTLQEKGVPMPVEKTLICPPRCRMGAITEQERAAVMARSPIGAKYDQPINRESAYEILTRRAADKQATATAPSGPAPDNRTKGGGMISDLLWGTRRRQGMVETMAKQAVRTIGSQVGRQIVRGILGSILGKK
ncbi:MAG: DUF853 family protein, partial [Desulfobulbus sp.]|nr:DUF853 family protein [Desulfobulbus sp.]